MKIETSEEKTIFAMDNGGKSDRDAQFAFTGAINPIELSGNVSAKPIQFLQWR